MTMPAADRAVRDTNVLLAATDVAWVDHEFATAALNEWPASGTVCHTSGQFLREHRRFRDHIRGVDLLP